jgi:hypothetical protein
MKTPSSATLYKGFRFPPEIICHCVWLYFRFSLSFRDIEEIMAERGIVLGLGSMECGERSAFETFLWSDLIIAEKTHAGALWQSLLDERGPWEVRSCVRLR